jgi:aminomethyltransferase
VQLQGFHEKNGHLTEFAGFNLPLWFTGIIPESLAVRNTAGVFDVSHMGRALICGKDSQRLLDKITTNDVSSLKVGQGQYSLMCNPDGGIRDDVLVFRLGNEEHLIVYNAGNRSKDYDVILKNSEGLSVGVKDVSEAVAMFAVQGPNARQLVQSISNAELSSIPRFGCAWTELKGVKTLVSRTGYTGEDGFEVFVWDSPLDNPENSLAVWGNLLNAGKSYGLQLCGLGARDLLRLEAGLCLYGSDMDESTNPYEARLGFVVKLHKDFIGRDKLLQIKEKGTPRVRVGLVTERKVIPRHGFEMSTNGTSVGKITSGSLSPLLNTGIAMGYVEKEIAQEGNFLDIQIRGRLEKAKVVKPPFYDTNIYGYARTR